MERLTGRKEDGHAYVIGCPEFEVPKEANTVLQSVADKCADLEDILGDTYDLDRLRELVEADKKNRARRCPKCGKMKLYPRIDWKYFYCYSCKETFSAEKIIHPKSAEAALAKETDHE